MFVIAFILAFRKRQQRREALEQRERQRAYAALWWQLARHWPDDARMN